MKLRRRSNGPVCPGRDEGAAVAPPEGPLAMVARDHDAIAMVREAVAARTVTLAYQPVVHAGQPDRIAFHEALIRILDRAGRLIPARDFIETVEHLDLGRQIDCLSLEMGLDALRADPVLRLSVNMSARSIGHPRWMQILRQAVAGDPTLAERLILEITEASAMVMPDVVIAFMGELRCRGVAFALDDFGAGFTSFRYLRAFHFDIVKIDGQFIRGLADSSDNRVLVAALVSIARHFEMFTVAESVETEAEAACCAAMGVTCLQGYLYGAPSIRLPWHDAGRLTA